MVWLDNYRWICASHWCQYMQNDNDFLFCDSFGSGL